MIKAKRSPQRSLAYFFFLFALIFVLGIGVGIFALKTLDNQGEDAPPQIALSTATTCAPTIRQYAPQAELVMDGAYSSTQIVYSASTTTAIPTSVALMNVQATATNLAPVIQGTPAPQGQAGANIAASPFPTISGAATYTPMPRNASNNTTNTETEEQAEEPNAVIVSATAAPTQTQAPLDYGYTQAAMPTSAPSSIDTSLRNPLEAGDIDDNAEWDVYMTYRRNFANSGGSISPIDDVDVSQRQVIRVVDTEGNPVLGALVEVFTPDGNLMVSSCTYATGYTLFFPNLYPNFGQAQSLFIRVSKNGIQFASEMSMSDEVIVMELDVEQTAIKLDILFLIDATGSMDDEIAQLSNNIIYISEEISALPDEYDVRYGLVSYKDGSYPTQVWDFTSDVSLFQSQLASLYTAGGNGETLNDGLDRALHQVSWRGDDTVKLVFLVGDEPPGIYENHPSYAISMLLAHQAGIKIHPIASSGLDVQGEYIFRQIAQSTMGHFIFLSYEQGSSTAVQSTGAVSGSAGGEDFGQYSVLQLHEIVLNLIREELAAQSVESSQ